MPLRCLTLSTSLSPLETGEGNRGAARMLAAVRVPGQAAVTNESADVSVCRRNRVVVVLSGHLPRVNALPARTVSRAGIRC